MESTPHQPEHPHPTTSDRTAADPDRLTAALAAAQAGNQQAFRTLYQDLHPHLLRQLRFSVGHTDAPDVASETWLHIIAGINDFHGTYRTFRSWAATIAQRRAVDHLRRTPPTDPTDPTSPGTFPDLPAPDDTEQNALEALATAATLSLVKVLPRDQRKIILLRVIVGLDAPATARLLGKHPGAVRTGTHRALRALAGQLPQSSAAASASIRARGSG